MTQPLPHNLAEMINAANASGWAGDTGIHVLSASRDEVTAELTVTPRHCQPYGIVHGGVHAGVIETLASIGAAIAAGFDGRSVVGLENHTSFLRAVRGGKLLAKATPITRGRRSQVWEVAVRDEAGKLCSTGRVRLLVLEAGAELAGEQPVIGGLPSADR
ncbi:MAG: PaaI family thioesterase [Byssovorax sp.]